MRRPRRLWKACRNPFQLIRPVSASGESCARSPSGPSEADRSTCCGEGGRIMLALGDLLAAPTAPSPRPTMRSARSRNRAAAWAHDLRSGGCIGSRKHPSRGAEIDAEYARRSRAGPDFAATTSARALRGAAAAPDHARGPRAGAASVRCCPRWTLPPLPRAAGAGRQPELPARLWRAAQLRREAGEGVPVPGDDRHGRHVLALNGAARDRVAQAVRLP